jgi:hypothetical protein
MERVAIDPPWPSSDSLAEEFDDILEHGRTTGDPGEKVEQFLGRKEGGSVVRGESIGGEFSWLGQT